MNSNLTKKDLDLIKGALRRVFSRSDYRKSIVEAIAIQHSDPERPRVKKWSMCPACNKPVPTYLVQVDHKDPIVPVDKTTQELYAEIGVEGLVNRIWCDRNNLTPMCIICHATKSKTENKERRRLKKERKPKTNLK